MAEHPDATPAHREISRIEDAVDKFVVGEDTMTADQTEPWCDTTRIILRQDAQREIAELKRGPREGDPGRRQPDSLWTDLLAGGLVDELHLVVGPVVVVGAGTPLLSNQPSVPSDSRTRTWDGSDNVLVQFATNPALVSPAAPQPGVVRSSC